MDLCNQLMLEISFQHHGSYLGCSWRCFVRYDRPENGSLGGCSGIVGMEFVGRTVVAAKVVAATGIAATTAVGRVGFQVDISFDLGNQLAAVNIITKVMEVTIIILDFREIKEQVILHLELTHFQLKQNWLIFFTQIMSFNNFMD